MNEIELLDNDGYPTDDALTTIEAWDIITQGTEPLLDLVKSIWWMPDWGFLRNEDRLELHTGGWSGNENIIRSLEKTFFWTFFWESSRRGGHYYFTGIKEFK